MNPSSPAQNYEKLKNQVCVRDLIVVELVIAVSRTLDWGCNCYLTQTWLSSSYNCSLSSSNWHLSNSQLHSGVVININIQCLIISFLVDSQLRYHPIVLCCLLSQGRHGNCHGIPLEPVIKRRWQASLERKRQLVVQCLWYELNWTYRTFISVLMRVIYIGMVAGIGMSRWLQMPFNQPAQQ